jgi:hypothetical protein
MWNGVGVMLGEDKFLLAILLVFVLSMLCVFWINSENDKKIKDCIINQEWLEDCDKIHKLNPDFDCLHEKYDGDRTNTSWIEYICTLKSTGQIR